QSALNDGFEDGLRVGRRTADRLENFSGRGLLLQRLVALADENGGFVFRCGAGQACAHSPAGLALGRPGATFFHLPSTSAAPPHGPRRCSRTAQAYEKAEVFATRSHEGRVVCAPRQSPLTPAKGGVQGKIFAPYVGPWIPACAGMSGGYLRARNGGETHRSARASSSRSLKRWILPVAVRGSASRASIQRGNFHGPALSFTWCLSVSSSPSSALKPLRSTMKAFGLMSPSASSLPMTAASSTASCDTRAASTSKGETHMPETL